MVSIAIPSHAATTVTSDSFRPGGPIMLSDEGRSNRARSAKTMDHDDPSPEEETDKKVAAVARDHRISVTDKNSAPPQDGYKAVLCFLQSEDDSIKGDDVSPKEICVDGMDMEDASFPSGKSAEAAEMGTSNTRERGSKEYKESGANVDELVFTDLSFAVPISRFGSFEKKTIISGVSGRVTSGNVMAVMGPSGAGKTTTLKILMQQAFGGTLEGSIKLNGKDLTFSMFKEKCGFVEQRDTLWPRLTTREHLEYAANLVLCDTKEEKKVKIDEILETIGLINVGGTHASNLSGGQKRRLSLALAMIKSPTLLLLDEPTSGLDAASANGVVDAITSLAIATGVMVICSIHQPSFEVWESFSHVTLLTGGCTAYMGLRRDAISHFELLGYPLPANTNPADHLLHLINSEFTDPAKVQGLVQAWDNIFNHSTEDIIKHEAWEDDSEKRSKPHFGTQLCVLLHRHLKLSILDPALYLGRMAVFLVFGIILSSVYIKTRNRTVDMAVERIMMEGWYFAVPSLLTIVHVYHTSIEMMTITHEVRLGFINQFAYIAAKILIEIPFMVFLSLAVLGTGGFAMVDFNSESFGLLILLFSVMLFAFESLAQATALAFGNTTYAMMGYVLFWFTAFLGSEIYVAKEDVIWPLALVFYVSPLRLAIQVFVYLDFHDTMWGCGDGLSLFSATAFTRECVGTYSGDKVLDMIGDFVFPVIKSNVNVEWCIGVTLIIAVTIKLVYTVSMVAKTSRHSTVVKAKGSTKPCLISRWRTLFVFPVLSIVVSIITGLSIWTAGDNSTSKIGQDQCFLALQSSGFDLRDHANYDNFFDDSSIMTLAEAGEYFGADGILEYVMFAFASPYTTTYYSRIDTSFKSYDAVTNTCSFQQLVLAEFTPDGTYSNSQVNKFHTSVMTNFDLGYETKKVSRINVFYTKNFLSFFFGTLLNSDATRHFVCSVINGPCGRQVDDCEGTLSNLPTVTINNHIDGNSQGCRALHAAFAAANTNHCPHISFDPKVDANGKTKCQQSEGIVPEDLFDEDDFNSFAKFQVEVGLDPELGYMELMKQKGTDNICKIQEDHLRNKNLRARDVEELNKLYNLDLFEYGPSPNRFLKFRANLCGGGTRNFVSLGRVVLGEYEDVSEFLTSVDQVRGLYLGPYILREGRMSPYTPTILSDPKTSNIGSEEEVVDVHGSVRSIIINDIIHPAQEKIRTNNVTHAALNHYTTSFVDGFALIGRDSNPLLKRNAIDTFVCRWVMKALFDIDADDATMDVLKYLFRGNIQTNYVGRMAKPFAIEVMSNEQADEIQDAFEKFTLIVQNSTPFSEYVPSNDNFNLTKKDFAHLTGEMIGLAGINVVGNLVQVLFEHITEGHFDFINHTNHTEVEAAVLESIRLNPPESIVTMVLSRETVLNVGGANKMFPSGTPVSLSLALASWDGNIFPDPFTFNHTRDNLMSHMISFAYRGHMDANSMPRRSCPGKNIALKAGIDVLTAWFEKKEQMKFG